MFKNKNPCLVPQKKANVHKLNSTFLQKKENKKKNERISQEISGNKERKNEIKKKKIQKERISQETNKNKERKNEIKN